MTWQPPQGSFVIEPPKPSPWVVMPTADVPRPEEAYRTDDNLKRLFGIAWAKTPKPFEAALEVFGEETNKALWASWNWLTDPLVVATKDNYAQNIELNDKLLDKDQLAARLLKFAEEKDVSGRFYICEAKDRLAAFKLYAEVQGFVGKLQIDASTNTFTNNELKITLVKPEKIEEKVAPIIDQEQDTETVLPLNLKLVGNSR
jgi:hypothetical protein